MRAETLLLKIVELRVVGFNEAEKAIKVLISIMRPDFAKLCERKARVTSDHHIVC